VRLIVGLGVLAFVAPACGGGPSTAASAPSAAPIVLPSGKPAPTDCAYHASNEAITGAHATASAIGWPGNQYGVVTCLGGRFFVQGARNRTFGFGIYAGEPATWVDDQGYLPAQVTSFSYRRVAVSITEFADRVTIGGRSFVVVYARVTVTNPTDATAVAAPGPSRGLVPLANAPDRVAPHSSAVHDYAIAVDRFGAAYHWPSPTALQTAGSFSAHRSHMRVFWDAQLRKIAQVHVPDSSLDDAYRSGFVYTLIARSGIHSNTGVNNYESEFSHDVVGILANLFTQGDFDHAHALLLDMRTVVGSPEYEDGLWTYSWPWAIYLMKTGDLAFVRTHFDTEGAAGASQPSIADSAHRIAADRTGPGGIIGITNDIDSNGYWTVDDYEALTGLAAYHYLAQRVGSPSEAAWAGREYDSLLAAVNRTLTATARRFHLDYLPCSMVQPNSANRCRNPQDANWAAPFLFGRWPWDASLFGARVAGPAVKLIDATYSYGFGRLHGTLPPDDFGGYPGHFYSSGYNAGYGSGGLASSRYRDQGIRSYQFMISHTQSGPYSWWESMSKPSASPWTGTHPSGGGGSSPHAWGIANANKVLLDSLVSQASDGTLIVGRGVPSAWLHTGAQISVANFPTQNGRRVRIDITAAHDSVTLAISGPVGRVQFEIPAFVGNIASATRGAVSSSSGTVTLRPGERSVVVHLRTPVA
jgi:hypothetical protein